MAPTPHEEVLSALRSAGLHVTHALEAQSALAHAAGRDYDVALIDIEAAEEAPGGVVGRLRRETSVPVILALTPPERARLAIGALTRGVDDYLMIPLDRAEVQARIGRLLAWHRDRDQALQVQEEMARRYLVGNLVSRSAGMRRVRDQVLRVAPARSTVLIQGESGVGKELVAKAIHYNSSRRDAPFIPINCSAIPVTLIESELFGHERGAFTGAVGRQKGKFELAEGGTIFLDEVGDMDLATQAKLLRVLEERSFMRVGGSREVSVDVRVVAATNTDLESLIARGRFRDDLYFRLKVITIRVPPLRDRREDIPDLARVLLGRISRDNGLRRLRLTDAAVRALTRHAWRGNVRELRNVLESAAIGATGDVLRAADLPPTLGGEPPPAGGGATTDGTTLLEMERDLLRRTLQSHAGNRTRAARALRIGVRTLQRKIRAYGLDVPAARAGRPRRQRSTVTPSPGLS